MLILRPIPALIAGDSNQETLEPNLQVTDFGAWFSGLLAYTPAAYAGDRRVFLRQAGRPDLQDIKNPVIGKELEAQEKKISLSIPSPPTSGSVDVPFEDLSDGEKCCDDMGPGF